MPSTTTSGYSTTCNFTSSLFSVYSFCLMPRLCRLSCESVVAHSPEIVTDFIIIGMFGLSPVVGTLEVMCIV